MLGKWNKSVIITYIGICVSVLGMFLAINQKINLAFVCLIIAGVCDLFDGSVARRMQRTEDEKRFGVEIDSLADVISFAVFPIVIYISLGLEKWYHIIIYFVYAIFQIVRLAYFGISLNEEDIESGVKFYMGLPVTASALILPAIYLLIVTLLPGFMNAGLPLILLFIAILNVLKIKIVKPHGLAYAIFSALASIMIVVYLVIL